MGIHETLNKVLNTLPEGSLREVLDFVEFIRFKQEQDEWQKAGLAHFSQCYGADDPDYGEASFTMHRSFG